MCCTRFKQRGKASSRELNIEYAVGGRAGTSRGLGTKFTSSVVKTHGQGVSGCCKRVALSAHQEQTLG